MEEEDLGKVVGVVVELWEARKKKQKSAEVFFGKVDRAVIRAYRKRKPREGLSINKADKEVLRAITREVMIKKVRENFAKGKSRGAIFSVDKEVLRATGEESTREDRMINLAF